MKVVNNSESSRPSPSWHRLVLGLMLLVAAGVAGAAWNWNRLSHLPDPDLVFRTEPEAVAGARRFLAAAKISTSDYDLSQSSCSTTDRLKGQLVWRIVWLAKPHAARTNQLSVLVGDRGWFYTDERSSLSEGILIEGGLTAQGNFEIVRSRHSGK